MINKTANLIAINKFIKFLDISKILDVIVVVKKLFNQSSQKKRMIKLVPAMAITFIHF